MGASALLFSFFVCYVFVEFARYSRPTTIAYMRFPSPEMSFPSSSNSTAKNVPDILVAHESLCQALTPLSVMLISRRDEIDERVRARALIQEMTFGTVKAFFPIGLENAGGDSLAEAELLVQKEGKNGNDLVIGDFRDVYSALPSKVMMGFKFASECPDAKVNLLFKLDIDTAVNWHNFLPKCRKILKEGYWDDEEGILRQVDRDYIWEGRRLPCVLVNKDPWDRNYDPLPFEVYAPYTSGPGYLMNMLLVRKLVELRQVDPTHYHNEDAMMGFLAMRIGVMPSHDPRHVASTQEERLRVMCGSLVASIKDCDCSRWYTFHSESKPLVFEEAIEAAQECRRRGFALEPSSTPSEFS